ncbi:hypothetical protein CPB86DRAFT_817363 [Serendipita vermifera]|nr:hypothetical protein CPB86DRAFT_817363 [Serendipita vermifera]
MEPPSKPNADVRAASVARLRRAASLPRLKDGRRPAVHGSDGDQQDNNTGTTPSVSAVTTPFTSTGELPTLTPENAPGKVETLNDSTENMAEAPSQSSIGEFGETASPNNQDPDSAGVADSEATIAPASTRGRRRRSRSRGSRSGTPKLDIPPNSTTSVITPLQRPSTPAVAMALSSETPEIHVQESTQAPEAEANVGQSSDPQNPPLLNTSLPSTPQHRNRTFISPISPFAQSIFPNGASPFTPLGANGPLSLAELQSNYTAGGLSRSVSVGRAHALHKLTGGNISPADTELFPPFSGTRTAEKSHGTQSPPNPEPRSATKTPPPASVISRSNTVAGGERVAARAAMFQILRSRVAPTTPTGLELPGNQVATHDTSLTSSELNAHSPGGGGVTDVNVVNPGTEELLVMPEIVARENKRRRRRSKRTSSSASGLMAAAGIPTSGEGAQNDHQEGTYGDVYSGFGSEGTGTSAGTTPASHVSPLPSVFALPGHSRSGSTSNLVRATPSPRPLIGTPPIQPLDAMMSLLSSNVSHAYDLQNPPVAPDTIRRIEELNDDDLRKQEEMQARYYQGLNLLRAASGGSSGSKIRVLIEEEDEPLPVPVMEPTSPAATESHEGLPSSPTTTFGRPSVDGSMHYDSSTRRGYHSQSPSLLSSTDGQSSPGFSNLTRVPVVMHQNGQDGHPTGFGRKGRIPVGGMGHHDERDETEPLVNMEPFPISAIITAGQDEIMQYQGYPSEVEPEARKLEAPNDKLGSRLTPSPRAWNPKSSASWIVDSYFRSDDEGENEDARSQRSTRRDTTSSLPKQDSVPPVSTKEDWDYVIPQNQSYSPRTPPDSALTVQPTVMEPSTDDSQTAAPPELSASSAPGGVDGVPAGPITILTSTEEGSEREARLGIGAREGTESQDSYRIGSQGAEFDDDGSGDRKNGNEKVSGWVKLRQTLIGRRSRSSSFVKERGEKGESNISRESGTSSKDQHLQHSPSTSISAPTTSSPSTGLHPSMSINIPRGVSPLPPPSPGDFAKYNDSKLMPFPGIYQLEEQRNKWKAGGGPPTPGTGEFPSATQPGSSPNNALLPNPNALSAPLPPSTRHSPDEGSQADNRSLQRNPSLNNMRQQDRAWPLPHEDYFDGGASVSRSASAGSYVKKWLKIPTAGSNVPSTSPSPAPYPYPISYSPAPSAGGEKPASGPNLNRRPSAADIFLPHGGLQRRPSTPNLLQGLSRKSSLADAHGSAANGHTLKSTSSKASLRKAFGIFGHETNAKDTPAVVEEEGASNEPRGVTIVATMQDAFPKPLVTPQETQPAPPAPSEPAVEIIRPTSPAPLTLPSPSAVPIPIPSNPVNEETPPRTAPTPPPVSRVQSPPPNHSRPQSPPIRAQSPSILKKDSTFRAQSPPIRTQSPAFDLGGPRSPFLSSPTRSHSPFLVHSNSFSRAKGLKALSSADIIASIESLLNRNSTGSSLDGKPKGLEEAPRKLLLVTPVLEVVSRNTVKDRTLFLFSDLLVVARCMSSTEGGLVMDKPYMIKNILELKRCTGPTLSQGSIDLSGDRRSPLLQSFVSDFRTDQARAITKLCDSVGIRKEEEPIFIADVLYRTFELERPRVGDYLARKTSRDVLHAFVDKFGFSGIRLDHALRIFLLSVLLSDEAEPRSLENLLAGFATRWFSANGNMVSFDKECAKNLVVSIVLLNASLHMTHTHQHPPATLQEFIDAVRAYDQRNSIKTDLLEDIYEAVKQEKISAPKANPGEPRFTVTISGATNPMHFLYRVKSDVVRVRIPAADPNFRIHLLGQGLNFEPPTLHFANSPEATFRVTGLSLGTKSVLYWRAGANAHLYNSMPLASEITIERPFMRNTLRIEYKEQSTGRERDSVLDGSDQGSSKGAAKKVYVFSIEDPREYDHWGKVLKMRINRAAGILDPERPPTAQGIYASIPAMSGGVPPRIRRAAETVALEVLKDTLIGNGASSSAASSPPESRIAKHAFGGALNQVFSQDGGDKKADSINGKESAKGRSRSNSTGIVRDGREIETLSVQNSLIPVLISMLIVQRESSIDNSQVGNGIGRPQTPKAVNIVRQ